MHWRVHQALGQTCKATLVYNTSRGLLHPLPFIALQLLHIPRVQCSSAVAFDIPSSHRYSGSHIPPLRSVNIMARELDLVNVPLRNRKGGSQEKHSQHTQDSSEQVAMVDALFAWWKARERTLEDFRKHAEGSPLYVHLQDRQKARDLAETMVFTTKPNRAHQVLIMAHVLGCKLKHNVYEYVTHCFANSGKWSFVPAMVSLCKRQTGRTTVRLLNWRARALVEIAHFRLLEGVLDGFAAENLKPTRRTFHIIISGYLRNRDLQKARQALSAMEAARFTIDASTHALIVSVYRSLGPDKSVQAQAFASLSDVDDRTGTIILNSLIKLSLDMHDIHGALEYLSFFERRLAGTTYPTNSGADTTQPDGDAPQTSSQSDTSPISSRILSPDVATFTMLIDYMAGERDLPRSLQMFKRMELAGIKPDGGIVAALIRAHIAVGDIPTALGIAASICSATPSACSLFRDLGVDVPIKTQHFCIPNDLPPSKQILNALLKGIQDIRGLNGTRTVLRIMHAVGIPPEADTVETIISYLAKTERARPRELIRVLRTLSDNIRPTLRHVHVILASIIRKEIATSRGAYKGWTSTSLKSEKPSSDDVFSRGADFGISRSFDPIAGIEIPRKLSYRALMRPLLRILSSRKARSDRATVALRMRHDAVLQSNMDVAKETLQTMLDRGMHPNQYHYAAMMEGYVQHGDMRAAEDVLASAVKGGIVPNAVMYTILIVGYARRGKPTHASRVFHKMLSEGIRPDAASVDAVASAYFVVGAYATARRVLLDLWPHVLPFPAELKEANLKVLARAFRKMAGEREHPGQKLVSRQRRVLRWKVNRIAHLLRRSGPDPVRRPLKDISRPVLGSSSSYTSSKII